MKEIKAVIRPNKLNELRRVLMSVEGFPGMTVIAAQGCSAPSRHGPALRAKDQLADFTPKVRIEIIAPDDLAEVLAARIEAVARTGHVGDGLVWLSEVDRAWFIHKTVASGGEA